MKNIKIYFAVDTQHQQQKKAAKIQTQTTRLSWTFVMVQSLRLKQTTRRECYGSEWMRESAQRWRPLGLFNVLSTERDFVFPSLMTNTQKRRERKKNVMNFEVKSLIFECLSLIFFFRHRLQAHVIHIEESVFWRCFIVRSFSLLFRSLWPNQEQNKKK